LNRALTAIGLLLAIAGMSLFYGVFVNVTPGFTAMLSALILLPIGSGILFFGAAYRGSLSAPPAAQGGGGGASSGTVWAAIGVAVIAILIALASLSVAFNAQSAASANTGVSQVSTNLNNVVSSLGVQPTTVAFKVDWCNTDNTGQDRYCPSTIVVNQGDIVQIMFIHNDTDAHTFTLDTGSYNFQINDSTAGMHNFVTNTVIPGSCSNSGTFAQESAGISGVYCVSGTSLLAPSGDFKIAQNGVPSVSPPALELIPITNTVQVNMFNSSSGASEIWGIGAFQATQPGIYEFFCHYHVSNGMFGYLIVLPNAYCVTNAAACGL
jgi:plastocyanin